MRIPEKRKPRSAKHGFQDQNVLASGKIDQRKSTQNRKTPQAIWQEKNPLARWAHIALQSALNRKLIEWQPCEVCGDPVTDGHHDDYNKPMAVRWLCRKHHKALHKRRRHRCRV